MYWNSHLEKDCEHRLCRSIYFTQDMMMIPVEEPEVEATFSLHESLWRSKIDCRESCPRGRGSPIAGSVIVQVLYSDSTVFRSRFSATHAVHTRGKAHFPVQYLSVLWVTIYSPNFSCQTLRLVLRLQHFDCDSPKLQHIDMPE